MKFIYFWRRAVTISNSPFFRLWAACFLPILLPLAACESTEAEAGHRLQESPSAEQGTAEAAIRNRIAGYTDVLTNRRDAALVGDYYTEDARLLGPGIDLDRRAVVEGVRAVMDSGTRVEVDRKTLELFIHGDAAYEIAEAEDIFISPDGATADTIRNNLFIRWEKGSDDVWRFDRVVLGPQRTNE